MPDSFVWSSLAKRSEFHLEREGIKVVNSFSFLKKQSVRDGAHDYSFFSSDEGIPKENFSI